MKDFLPNRKEPFICDFGSKSMRDRIDKEIVHLTKNRYEDGKTKWSVPDIACCLTKYLCEFSDELENTKVYVDEKYKEIKEEINDLKTDFCKNEPIKEPVNPSSTATSEMIKRKFDIY